MFGWKKKKYIKDLGSSSFKIQTPESGVPARSENLKYVPPKYDDTQRRQPSKANLFNFEKLLYEDSVLIQLEHSFFEDGKKSLGELKREAESFSQKPVTRFLNLIAIFAAFRFGYYLLNAEFLKVNSIIYIFILLAPFLIGMPIIFFATLAVWRRLFSPKARIISRVLFKYWYLVFALLYLKYTISIFDQIG